MASRRRKKQRPEPLVGSMAFGHDEQEERPTGSQAFGGADQDAPLRGALAFGNDPTGAPTGSQAVGGPDEKMPLRGALLFGNDPQGAPTGALAVGNPEPKAPLKGALLFGNSPTGDPTGALAFGNADARFRFRGSQAFGVGQGIRERLYKDVIGYDFGGVLLQADEGSLAGIKKHPNDALRVRVVKVLERQLAMDVQRLRHGLNEDAIKWGLLADPGSTLDKELAEALRERYKIAPGERLGIGHVRDLLEDMERMHTFELYCSWDRQPVTLSVKWYGETIAAVETRFHKAHTFFELRDTEGEVLAYADRLDPRDPHPVARVRGVKGAPIATFHLTAPAAGQEPEDTKRGATSPRFEGTVKDAAGEPLFHLEEKIAAPGTFWAVLTNAAGERVGQLRDRLEEQTVRAQVELDLAVPEVLAWALGAIVADLARLRREGWPQAKAEPEESVPSVREALGPVRRPS